MARKYEDAIRTLNELQKYLPKTRNDESESSMIDRKYQPLPEFIHHLNCVGIKVEDLEQLAIIHVSGTKGKGSTCAFSENIIRHSGYKTGLYTSPHLVEVRERIRINGQPLTRSAFVKHFWHCYEKIEGDKDSAMPTYFGFLTIMCFRIFLAEKVDVAVIEVGLGGTFDCTNVIRKPIVCGISCLGMDHIDVLGDTIDEIADHKAGIMKHGVPAFTIQQEAGGMDVIAARATEVGTSVRVAPKLSDYPGPLPELGLAGEHQQLNATLALQLCWSWIAWKNEERDDVLLEKDQLQPAPAFKLPPTFQEGLKNCCWLGRAQIIKRPSVTFYLDGAHTIRSIKACINWFQKTSEEEYSTPGLTVVQAILFSCSNGRDPLPLVAEIMPLGISYALFCPHIASLTIENFEDQKILKRTYETDMAVCQENETAWLSMSESVSSKSTWIFGCVSDALAWLFNGRDPLACSKPLHSSWPPIPEPLANADRIQLLVIGSVRLMGAVLKALGSEVVRVVASDSEDDS